MSYDYVGNGMSDDLYNSGKEVPKDHDDIGGIETPQEEVIPQATEEEQKDFEEYQKEVKKQQKGISSYEDLLRKKEQDEKKVEIKRLTNRLGERYMNLHGQERLNPAGRDRLGKNAQYYMDVWNDIKNNTLFDGDIDNQLQLLKILASPESDLTAADILIKSLEQFEAKTRFIHK